MLPSGSVEVRNLWKRFSADRRRMLLRDEIERMRTRRKTAQKDRYRWVLRDINFDVAPGESVGLIGMNGSGKSTLLKLLTRVMYPYAGRVSCAGRVGALIEVRAGIHPDLTGRENVFLYGSLLGLSRKKVAQRFDEIVDFAEIEEAVDRQVKFFSSGMQMRLGFAVAAFLEPDVLLVDEVLAVGDASFQQKCLERMRYVLANGTTLIFVSHDLAAVEATCSRGLWLDQGVLRVDSNIKEALGAYRTFIEEGAEYSAPADSVIRLVKATVTGPDGGAPQTSRELEAQIVLDLPSPSPANILLGVSEGSASSIMVVRRDMQLAAGTTEIRCTLDHLPLPRGRYYLWLGVFDRKRDLLPWHPAARFDVAGPDLQEAPRAIVRVGPVHVDSSWNAVAL